MIRRAAMLLSLVCAMLPFSGIPLVAQDNPMDAPQNADGLMSITLVLVNRGTPPAFLRRLHVEPNNVILLDSATVDVQRLSDAVFSLLVMEAVDREGVQRNDRAMHRASLSSSHPVYPWASEALRRLHGAEKEPIRGVGRHRALQIWMPHLRGRRQ